ncbi:hypothetical protein [Burkholderia gladioli]|uniref:hypothetical protein n=1 Tax=Burkholderia gladioli TaxID=28095 RepID=UPI0002DACB39|nr:hypothetical protein [Burkholderia gladioli]
MQLKLCIYCRHYGDNVPAPLARDGRQMLKQPGDGRLCTHPSTSVGISLTTGEAIRTRTADAELQRSTPNIIARWTGKCGTAGRHFEPMEDAQCSPS